jgi:hypothetical protein
MTITDTDLAPDEEDQFAHQAEMHLIRERFKAQTMTEVLQRMQNDPEDPWLVPGLISAKSTFLYGPAKIGKSWLVSHLVGALLNNGRFLDVQVPTDRRFSVAVAYTDHGGDLEYTERIHTIADDASRVGLLDIGGRMHHDDWESLLEFCLDQGHNVLVIDNATQALPGSMNEDHSWRVFYDELRMFIRAGIAVVIVGHSTSKTFNGKPSDTHMGSDYAVQGVRWIMRVKKVNRRLEVKVHGNHGHGRTLKVRPGAGARFDVESVVLDEEAAGEKESQVQDRDKATFDRNAEHAQYVVDHCQGMIPAEVAQSLSDQFGGSVQTFKNSLSTRALSKLLDREGDGTETRWARTSS